MSSAKSAKAPPAASPAAAAHRSWVRWEYLSPALVLLGVLAHAVLEGLAIGLQVRSPRISPFLWDLEFRV